MAIDFFILGRGLSGQTFAKALAALEVADPELVQALGGWSATHWLSRENYRGQLQTLASSSRASSNRSVLCIANPHGLHAEAILEAHRIVDYIFCEKPAVTDLKQIQALRSLGLNIPISVMHGYRATWGVSYIKDQLEKGVIGEIVDAEVRYLQSSVAQEKLGQRPRRSSWKDDPQLSGLGDVILDIVPHALDLVVTLLGPAERIGGVRQFALTQKDHRDTHVVATVRHVGGKPSFLRVSKIEHGHVNELRLRVLGTAGSLEWSFQNPDQVCVGQGSRVELVRRASNDWALGFPPFHGGGWIDGYAEILKSGLRSLAKLPTHRAVPTLGEHLDYMEILFQGEF